MAFVIYHTRHRNAEHSPQKGILTDGLINKVHICENSFDDLRHSLITNIGLISNVPHLDQPKVDSYIIYFFISDPP